MNEDILERLSVLKAELCLTWVELAEKIGCKQSMMSMMKSGERSPGPKLLRKILAAEVEAGLARPKCRIRDAAEAEGFIAGMLFESMGNTPAFCQMVAEKILKTLREQGWKPASTEEKQHATKGHDE